MDTSDTQMILSPAAPVPEYAGFLVRFVAKFIDGIIMGTVISALLIPIYLAYILAIIASTSYDSSSTIFGMIGMMFVIMFLFLFISIVFAAIFVLTAIYFAWFESSKYMGTPGKMIMKLKVTDTGGNRITFLTALLRFISKMVFNQVFYIGSLFILFNDKKQGLYDLLLNTYVIKE